METSYLGQAVSAYGYWAVLAGTFFEGESVFLLGEIAARHGLLNPWLVALIALIGGFLGDQMFFLLSVGRSRKILDHFPAWARKVRRLEGLVKRRAVLLILFSRYLYGLRMAIPVACGLAEVRPGLYMVCNLVSAILWSATFGTLGYLLGEWLFANVNLMKNLQLMAVLLVGLAALVFGLGRLVHHFFITRKGT